MEICYMKGVMEGFADKGKYTSPELDIFIWNSVRDVLCMSSEGKDNDFDAGGLGNFTNGNQ